MSKSTKIIAALGVVAGLGVAALPMASFATQAATGDAEVIVVVDPAIALEISGNNDVNPYGPVADITPDGTSFNGITETTIKTSSSKVNMTQYDKIEGNSTNGFRSTLKVTTNDAGGYTLTVKAKEAADVDLTNAAGDKIESIAAAGALTAGSAAWGLQVADSYAGTTLTTSSWSPVTTAGDTVKVAPAAAAGYTQDTTIVNYGVATAQAQPTGTYQATLTYTATTAN